MNNRLIEISEYVYYVQYPNSTDIRIHLFTDIRILKYTRIRIVQTLMVRLTSIIEEIPGRGRPRRFYM